MMNPNMGPFFGQYGVSTTFYFTVAVPSATNDDRMLDAAVPWVAGDVTVIKDGGSEANIGTLPTRVGTTNLYEFTLTASEMQGRHIVVSLIDQDGPAWRDLAIHIVTKLQLGQIDVDATQIGGNTHGITSTGVGTGQGLNLEGASDAYITNIFDQLEGTEPSGAPADNATVMAILQVIKRRFAGKRDQSASKYTQYKDDGSTAAWTATVSSSGTKQVIGKAT